MSKTKVVFYENENGRVPILEWLDSLPQKVVDKCTIRLERLAEAGHELRRPEADFLRDGIYELRVGLQNVNYRMLYFFYGNVCVVVSHGLTKEREVPAKEINKAIEHKGKFESNPRGHTHEE